MMQRWEPDMVRFMRDASESGTYNRTLASLIGPKISPDSRVCDAGCGLGYLSLELARYVKHVTAVDINPDALQVLRENKRAQAAENISVRCADVMQAQVQQLYDAMVFCFFGSIEEIMSVVQKQCRGDVFVITRNYNTHRFSVKAHKMCSAGYQDVCRYLKMRQIPFECEEHTLDMGQPFKHLKDARRFFQLYSKDDQTAITDEFLWSKLKHTDKTEFPLYMPHERQVGIVHFHVKNIPQVAPHQFAKMWYTAMNPVTAYGEGMP